MLFPFIIKQMQIIFDFERSAFAQIQYPIFNFIEKEHQSSDNVDLDHRCFTDIKD